MDPGVITERPQSGERMRGIANARAALEHDRNPPLSLVQRIIGAEDTWVLTPSFTLVGVAGTGDHYMAEARTKYANGDTSCSVHIFQFQNGKIVKITEYSAAPFPPAEWRSAWVEMMDQCRHDAGQC